MTDHTPPTEAELYRWWMIFGYLPLVRLLITEIRRLRALCGEINKPMSIYQRGAWEQRLRAAAKGEV